MKNKQLNSKDLLMNKKEELIWRVIDNVISCCAVTRIDGAKSITREDVVGKSREENVVLTRCLVVEQMVHAEFTISTIAFILVTVPYQPFQAIPNCVAYQYGMYNGGNNLNGFWF